MEKKRERMKELTELLTKAGKAYYQESREIMSNFEYDRLYDELQKLEEETGIVLAGSPTRQVGYEVLEELPKERHEQPMLSLDKTKEVEVLKDFVGAHKVLLSWKMDGLTVVLTYREGTLFKAVTRGNGEIGEVITNNARVFENVPLTIPYKGELVLRGEAVISYKDFEKINEEIADVDAKYKNPRNLCSGSVRQLNNEITARRHVQFFAFSLVRADGVDFENSREKQFIWLSEQGFNVVEHKMVTRETVEETVAWFAEEIENNPIPSDGLVAIYDDIAYGISLGRTAKFPRDAFAFKWADESVDSTLDHIEWSCAASTITPVAVFEPVELEGTTVKRASLCNISECERLGIGAKGTVVSVIKANKIIPKIIHVSKIEGKLEIPSVCPVCGQPTEIHVSENSGTKTLKCTNPDCAAKKLKKFKRFVSKGGMDIDGISEATLARFINEGWIRNIGDIYRLNGHREEIAQLDGFGEKSADNIMASLEKAKTVDDVKLIYALNIPLVGVDVARKLLNAEDLSALVEKASTTENVECFAYIDGIGSEKSSAFVKWFRDEKNLRDYQDLLQYLTVNKTAAEAVDDKCKSLTFVVTGDVHHYKNRNELKAYIEAHGGKVTGSVSKSTNYLINNDVTSTSSKNTKAKALGVPIISEDEFIAQFGE